MIYVVECLNPLRELSILSILFRFFIATGCSAIIGYERSKNQHDAGLRTHIIVCIGATSVMILNQYLAVFFNSNADPARLGAQVISGIGFLGAGTIVIRGHQQGQQIKGLTTAAGLWASSCMGLVIGSGFYEAALIMCVFLSCVIVGLNGLEGKYLKDSTVMRLYIEYTAETPFSTIHATLRNDGWHLSHLEYLGGANGNMNSVVIDVQRSGRDTDTGMLLDALRCADGILFVEDA